MSIQTATRTELEGRRHQIQEEKKRIEAIIQEHKICEQKSIEHGDGRTAIASRKTVETPQEKLERRIIEENAVTKQIEEYEKNKLEAEKLKPQIEQLYK